MIFLPSHLSKESFPPNFTYLAFVVKLILRKRSQLKRLLRENHLYLKKESFFVERREKEHSIFLLYQAIKSLPLRQRKAVILHAIKEVPFSRISLTLKESREATKSTYYRAIRNLRKYFKKRRPLFEQKTRAYEPSSFPVSKGAKAR